MLCLAGSSGFDKGDEWGYRALEPNRCCITSIALVLLKTGISFPPFEDEPAQPANADRDAASQQQPRVNPGQLQTAHKLLLFWRKPAVRIYSVLILSSCVWGLTKSMQQRKCWWDATEMMDYPMPQSSLDQNGSNPVPLKVWARRIWTLETVCVAFNRLVGCHRCHSLACLIQVLI